MRKSIKRVLLFALAVLVVPPLVLGAWLCGYAFTNIQVREVPLQFTLKQGSGLRSAARQMEAAGALNSPWQFEVLARLLGDASRIQAGNYELRAGITPYELIAKLTSGDRSQDKLTIVEGWNWQQVRAALDAHPAIRHDTRGISDADLLDRLGIREASPEGLFFPDTYFFANGESDFRVLERAHAILRTNLDMLWSTRASGLPLSSSYEALILASIIEKETGRREERTMIASVFVNRLRAGMRLQTDPTVIYGLGAQFDGDLRKRDLLMDTPYNTYTRTGLPPTPIAMPGLGSLSAALNPASSSALYFVSRGDGTSHFSSNLTEHERAVTKYQRRGNR